MATDEHAAGDGAFEHAGVVAVRGEVANPVPVHVGIVVARFNAAITERLFDGAVAALLSKGIPAANIEAHQVPGSVELPLAALELARSGRVRAVVVLGAVIRGETAHFDYVCDFATSGLRHVVQTTSVPVGFGVVTTDNVAQAEARAQAWPAGRNAGADAALAALESAAVIAAIQN